MPASLSQAQQNVLHSTFQQTQTLVVGPPGTGKSFTIAALAIHALSEGKSVLIASKNSHAVNVVGDKIERDFGLQDIVLRASNRDYERILKKRLKAILSGMGVYYVHQKDVFQAKKQIQKLQKRINRLQNSITERLTNEEQRGEFLHEFQGSLWQRFQRWRMLRAMGKEAELNKLFDQLEEWTSDLHEYKRKYIQMRLDQKLFRSLRSNRSTYQQLLKALQARQGNKKETIFSQTNFAEIFKAMPIWIVSATDVHRVLPFHKELFDVVIIDEATQCDAASCLPLLQRAKHSVIVGDPKQLRHISFLSRGAAGANCEQ